MPYDTVKLKLENETGYITLGNTLSTHDTREIRRAFDELEQNMAKEVVIDMSNVTQMDSSGIGVLVIYLKKLKDRKGVMRLVSPRDEIKRILKLVNLYNQFDIID